MPIYQIVISVLSQYTQSHPQKTIADAILDGTISVEDLLIINNASAFPENHFNTRKLPEGAYSSKEVMNAFTRTIGLFLSHKRLYEITHKLIQAEISTAGVNTFANHSLAKSFFFYEMERHANNTQAGNLPAVTLSHLQSLIMPLLSKENENLQQIFNSFALQRIKLHLLDQVDIHKYLMVIDYYDATSRFDLQAFALMQLSEESSRQPAMYPEYLQQMVVSYKTLAQATAGRSGASLFAGKAIGELAGHQMQARDRHHNCVIS